CTLLKRDGTVLKESDLSGRDAISFGATQCDDLVCVRDSSFPPTTPDAPAQGFCSHSCASTSSCVSASELRLSCRDLLLDDAALGQTELGNSKSPLFCTAVR